VFAGFWFIERPLLYVEESACWIMLAKREKTNCIISNGKHLQLLDLWRIHGDFFPSLGSMAFEMGNADQRWGQAVVARSPSVSGG
jgi:hypothetical protein